MKTLILLIIAIVFSSNCFAALYVNGDRPIGNYYFCQGKHLVLDEFECENLKKGHVLTTVDSLEAVLYCDTEFPILMSDNNLISGIKYDCIYNGRKIKYLEHRIIIRR